LEGIAAIYPDDTNSVNQILNFNAGGLDYSFNTDSLSHLSPATVNITATPANLASTVSIKMQGESLDLVSGIGVRTAAVTLPAPGFYINVEITVTAPASESGSRTYNVAIMGYTTGLVKWTATVTNPIYSTITAVTMYEDTAAQQALAMQHTGGGVYVVWAAPTYVGKTFTVSMTDSGISYSTKAMSPTVTVVNTTERSVSLNLSGVPYGRTISNVVELRALENQANRLHDWSVIRDIRLPDNETWDGPNNFAGKLYGNNHTISNFKFEGNIKGDTGLFDSLTGTAELYDFTLEVVPAAAAPVLQAGVRFAGVVGAVFDGTIKVSGVTVSGTVNMGAPDRAINLIYIGGIIGEFSSTLPCTLTIENCVSTLNINAANLGSFNVTGSICVGGLVGRCWNSTAVTLKDSYSSGTITIGYDGTTAEMAVGGLIGRLDWTPSVTVNHCYSDSVITSAHSAAGTHRVGGLIGYMDRGGQSLTNSVALNPTITATGGTVSVNRAVGIKNGSSSISNVYALAGMLVNTNPVTGGAVNNVNGADAASAAAVDWSGLGFLETNGWDMSVTPPLLK
jgi:hypothetical protein